MPNQLLGRPVVANKTVFPKPTVFPKLMAFPKLMVFPPRQQIRPAMATVRPEAMVLPPEHLKDRPPVRSRCSEREQLKEWNWTTRRPITGSGSTTWECEHIRADQSRAEPSLSLHKVNCLPFTSDYHKLVLNTHFSYPLNPILYSVI